MLLQLFYIYFSARQIQEGYPHKTTRVLEKVKDDVSLWGYYSYKLYTSIPFIYEINTLLEWTTTKTVLEMKKWFSVEEIHRLLYQALYDRDGALSDEEYIRAKPRVAKEKVINGFAILFGIMLILILPLLLFSSSSPVLVDNPVVSTNVYFDLITPNTTVRLTDYENIYSSTIINRPTFESWSTLFTANVDGKQQSVFNDAWATSAQIVSIPSDAVKEWSVPELAVNQIIESLHQCNGHELNMRIQFKRNGPSDNKISEGLFSVVFTREECDMMIDTLMYGEKELILPHFFPRLFYLSASDTIQYVDSDVSQFNSFALGLHKGDRQFYIHSSDGFNTTEIKPTMQFWVVNDPVLNSFVSEELGLLDSSDPILGSIGIIGLYITILITVGGVIRTYLLPQVTDLLYSEIPDPQLLLSLIHSMYICRFSNYKNHFKDEKNVYDLLVRVFRSSDLFVKLTEDLPNYKSVRNLLF